MPREGTVATVPLGYADGVPRALSATGGGARPWSSSSDGRHRHHGPADGRCR
ncbi:MAG TPA: alanine racemase C-terminal domain-containing protein [Acidimicrobiia bacterium]|nr:alanine racemase C-terminal domain-containing protein [Acidimicrobiia bacterium]